MRSVKEESPLLSMSPSPSPSEDSIEVGITGIPGIPSLVSRRPQSSRRLLSNGPLLLCPSPSSNFLDASKFEIVREIASEEDIEDSPRSHQKSQCLQEDPAQGETNNDVSLFEVEEIKLEALSPMKQGPLVSHAAPNRSPLASHASPRPSASSMTTSQTPLSPVVLLRRSPLHHLGVPSFNTSLTQSLFISSTPKKISQLQPQLRLHDLFPKDSPIRKSPDLALKAHFLITNPSETGVILVTPNNKSARPSHKQADRVENRLTRSLGSYTSKTPNVVLEDRQEDSPWIKIEDECVPETLTTDSHAETMARDKKRKTSYEHDDYQLPRKRCRHNNQSKEDQSSKQNFSSEKGCSYSANISHASSDNQQSKTLDESTRLQRIQESRNESLRSKNNALVKGSRDLNMSCSSESSLALSDEEVSSRLSLSKNYKQTYINLKDTSVTSSTIKTTSKCSRSSKKSDQSSKKSHGPSDTSSSSDWDDEPLIEISSAKKTPLPKRTSDISKTTQKSGQSSKKSCGSSDTSSSSDCNDEPPIERSSVKKTPLPKRTSDISKTTQKSGQSSKKSCGSSDTSSSSDCNDEPPIERSSVKKTPLPKRTSDISKTTQKSGQSSKKSCGSSDTSSSSDCNDEPPIERSSVKKTPLPKRTSDISKTPINYKVKSVTSSTINTPFIYSMSCKKSDLSSKKSCGSSSTSSSSDFDDDPPIEKSSASKTALSKRTSDISKTSKTHDQSSKKSRGSSDTSSSSDSDDEPLIDKSSVKKTPLSKKSSDLSMSPNKSKLSRKSRGSSDTSSSSDSDDEPPSERSSVKKTPLSKKSSNVSMSSNKGKLSRKSRGSSDTSSSSDSDDDPPIERSSVKKTPLSKKSSDLSMSSNKSKLSRKSRGSSDTSSSSDSDDEPPIERSSVKKTPLPKKSSDLSMSSNKSKLSRKSRGSSDTSSSFDSEDEPPIDNSSVKKTPLSKKSSNVSMSSNKSKLSRKSRGSSDTSSSSDCDDDPPIERSSAKGTPQTFDVTMSSRKQVFTEKKLNNSSDTSSLSDSDDATRTKRSLLKKNKPGTSNSSILLKNSKKADSSKNKAPPDSSPSISLDEVTMMKKSLKLKPTNMSTPLATTDPKASSLHKTKTSVLLMKSRDLLTSRKSESSSDSDNSSSLTGQPRKGLLSNDSSCDSRGSKTLRSLKSPSCQKGRLLSRAQRSHENVPAPLIKPDKSDRSTKKKKETIHLRESSSSSSEPETQHNSRKPEKKTGRASKTSSSSSSSCTADSPVCQRIDSKSNKGNPQSRGNLTADNISSLKELLIQANTKRFSKSKSTMLKGSKEMHAEHKSSSLAAPNKLKQSNPTTKNSTRSTAPSLPPQSCTLNNSTDEIAYMKELLIQRKTTKIRSSAKPKKLPSEILDNSILRKRRSVLNKEASFSRTKHHSPLTSSSSDSSSSESISSLSSGRSSKAEKIPSPTKNSSPSTVNIDSSSESSLSDSDRDLEASRNVPSTQNKINSPEDSTSDTSVYDDDDDLPKNPIVFKTGKSSRKNLEKRCSTLLRHPEPDDNRIEGQSSSSMPQEILHFLSQKDMGNDAFETKDKLENWELLIKGKYLPGIEFWTDILKDDSCQPDESNFTMASGNQGSLRKVYKSPNIVLDNATSKRVMKWIDEKYGSLNVFPINAYCPMHTRLSSDALQVVKSKFPQLRTGRLSPEEMKILRQNLKKLMKDLDLSPESARELIIDLAYSHSGRKIKAKYFLGCFAGQGILQRRFIFEVYKWITTFTFSTSEALSQDQIQELIDKSRNSNEPFRLKSAITSSGLQSSIQGSRLANILFTSSQPRGSTYVWQMKDIFCLLEYIFKKYALRTALDALKIKFPYKIISQDLGYKSGTLRANLQYVLTILSNHERGASWSDTDLLRALEYVMSNPATYSCISDVKWKDIKERLFPNVPIHEFQYIFKKTDSALPFRQRCLQAHRYFSTRTPKERFNNKEIIDFYEILKKRRAAPNNEKCTSSSSNNNNNK